MLLLYCSYKENVHTRDQDFFWCSGETPSFPRGMAASCGTQKLLTSPLLLKYCVMRSQTTSGSVPGLKKQSLSPLMIAKPKISAGVG